jgi:hypothetical protein
MRHRYHAYGSEALTEVDDIFERHARRMRDVDARSGRERIGERPYIRRISGRRFDRETIDKRLNRLM